MINRLLEQLDNPRRHLTFLVGVLALVFVLTGVVAWRASAAERDRAELARKTLDETAQMALKDWSLLYNTYAGSLIPHYAQHVMRPQLSLDTLREAAGVANICAICSPGQRIPSAFSIDPVTAAVEWSGDPVDARVGPAVLARIAAGDISKFHEALRGGLYFIETDSTTVSALVFVISEGSTDASRIVGVVLDRATSREMLAYAATKARLLQTSTVPGATAEELFARSAYVGGTQLFGAGSSATFQRAVVDAPVFGLTLAVGPQPAAVDLLQFGADPTSERLTMIMLLLVIGALLAMALLQVRREAELTRLRADFVSGVSHELRTPLAQIRMFTETLLLGRVRSDVERRRSLEIIDQEARRLAYLVENVLLFSKTEGGRRARVAPEPTHFAEEVRHAVESFTLLSRNRDVELRTELQENITVEVDRMALRQILINLVDNALKYGPAGQRITVGAALFDDVARLWVDDEGTGIPAEERSRVFESFYRLPRDIESRVTGSGIGLAVVRELARLHGGDAWAEAAPDRGARIVVQFPDAYVRSDQAGDFAAAS